MSWRDLAAWWRIELSGDPSYESDISPLVLELLGGDGYERLLDVGCGEGRLMGILTQQARSLVGLDLSPDLLSTARMFGHVVRAELPGLDVFRSSVFDAAIVSLVLEHLDDEGTLLRELGRVVRPGGRMVLVINHPIFTAPDSAPIQEVDEVLWRPGRYFDRGFTDERAGEGTIRFHHRTMAELLNAASAGGWDLDRMVERGVSEGQVERHPALGGQAHIPRLLGVSWTRRSV